jgi:hypothetical protein
MCLGRYVCNPFLQTFAPMVLTAMTQAGVVSEETKGKGKGKEYSRIDRSTRRFRNGKNRCRKEVIIVLFIRVKTQ